MPTTHATEADMYKYLHEKSENILVALAFDHARELHAENRLLTHDGTHYVFDAAHDIRQCYFCRVLYRHYRIDRAARGLSLVPPIGDPVP